MKFIHAADLHIDSPLRGLETYDGAPVKEIRNATRQAMQNLVQLAVAEEVAFVIVAGDLFDGKWQDMRTGLWMASQFRELQRADVKVYLLQGNHDAASKVRQALSWPDNVHLFSVDKPETLLLPEVGVALHGQGFAKEKVTRDLTRDYPAAVEGLFNIGVLHTSLTGNAEHDTYAPTTLSRLVACGYDYWALGHIHARSELPLHEEPYIAYSGNLQGRHIRETGAKGCLLVTVDDGALTEAAFVATDTLRWHQAEVKLEPADGRSALLQAVEQELTEIRANAEGRRVAARVMIRGNCQVHRELVNKSDRDEVIAEIRNLANELGDDLWVEKVKFATSPPVDLNRLREGSDLLGELLRSLQQAAEDPQLLEALQAELKPFEEKAAAELKLAGVDLNDPQQIISWLAEAESLLIGRLTE